MGNSVYEEQLTGATCQTSSRRLMNVEHGVIAVVMPVSPCRPDLRLTLMASFAQMTSL